ncbi:diguanylate cyclase (GGDEF)-like protein [Roseateles toxinivorans]|uniref:diguanylate cyclase n=1 Tax=Roseateles toxinivorans TaxID=270368 RepID=A0A4R6QSY2_9BURK|nr:diguanylate cyclase (GGDEF)-like protein [Roseateles toxinivorans]
MLRVWVRALGWTKGSGLSESLCIQRHLRHIVILCSACLVACSPAPDTPAAGQFASGSPELEQLERTGTAAPAAAAEKAKALYENAPQGSFSALDILSVQGALLAEARDDAALADVVTRLENWPNPQLTETARATVSFLRARQLWAANNLREAELMMDGIDKQQLSNAPPPLRMRFLRALGRLKDGSGRIEDAISLQLQALALAEQSGQRWLQALCRGELAQAYLHAQQPDRALSMVDEATRLAEQDRDAITLLRVYTQRGIVYAQLEKPEESLRSAEAAIRYAREANSPRDLALSLANLADNYLRKADFAHALTLSEEALPLARQAKDRTGELVALTNIGLAKISLGQIAEGKRFVEQAMVMDKQGGGVSSVGDTLNELGIYLERAGDAAGAIEAYHAYRQISDEDLQQEDRKAILEAQERFDSERRAKEIELLNRDNGIAAEQLRRGNLQMRLWALLAGCFVVSGILLALLYQRVRKTNAALATSNEQLKIQSEIDPLTGLANRRHFQLAIKRLADDGKLRGTVFLIDIDHFKRINDRFGHAAGDAVLVDVSHRLREAVRADDLVVRWGGEEFLIVVESRSAETVQALAQRLLDMIGKPPVSYAGQAITVTASIGFASFPIAPHDLAVNWERAINLVDTVMYMAKAHGRNRAYGIDQLDVQDESALDELAQGMDAAWREGRVGLRALQGPQTEALT